MRQRPGTANGTVFITLEDGQGCVNVIIWGTLVEQFRQAVIGAHLLGVKGRVQKQGQIIHFMAEALYHCDHYLKQLQTADRHALTLRSRDFH
jgi:error-prone DNA polymerase